MKTHRNLSSNSHSITVAVDEKSLVNFFICSFSSAEAVFELNDVLFTDPDPFAP